jgi:hypothetical protein
MQRSSIVLTTTVTVLAAIACKQPKPTPTAVPASEQAAAPKTELPKCADCIPVTADNFSRAETDLYMNAVATQRDGFGKFEHERTPTPLDKQTVIRMNRDTLYSGAVFDLDAGPATITLPDGGKRFMSMQVINEDQYPRNLQKTQVSKPTRQTHRSMG